MKIIVDMPDDFKKDGRTRYACTHCPNEPRGCAANVFFCPLANAVEYKEKEPLAAKIAFDKEWLYEVSSSGGFYWQIKLRPRTIEQGSGANFFGHTYPEAESKAREYLEGLPDKGEK